MILLSALTNASIKELYGIRTGLLEFCNRDEISQKIVDIAAEAVLVIETELARRTPVTSDDGLYKLLGLMDEDDLSGDILTAVGDAKILLAA